VRGNAVTAIRKVAGPALAGFVLIAILAACGGAEPSAGASASGPANPGESPTTSDAQPPARTPDPAAVAAARTAIDATRLADADSVTAVDAIRSTRAAAQAAADALAAGADGDARWAATWVYASSGRDPAPLRALLEDADASIRAMAAAALLALGDRDGAATLAALIPLDDELRGSRPPLALGAFAAGSLDRYIDGPSIADGAARSDVATAWTTWLAAYGSTMTFDPATGRWIAS
jgi:hypothetical protein